MNRVPDLDIERIHEPTPDGAERLQAVYDQLIESALRRLRSAPVDNAPSRSEGAKRIMNP